MPEKKKKKKKKSFLKLNPKGLLKNVAKLREKQQEALGFGTKKQKKKTMGDNYRD